MKGEFTVGMSKDQLLQDLRASADEVVNRLREFPAERLEEGRYENGWNGRQILAHLASVEWMYPRFIERTLEPEASGSDSSGPRQTIDEYNAKQVAKRDETSIQELLDEFEKNRRATIAAVSELDQESLQTPARSIGGSEGTLIGVLHYISVMHVMSHLDDITKSD